MAELSWTLFYFINGLSAAALLLTALVGVLRRRIGFALTAWLLVWSVQIALTNAASTAATREAGTMLHWLGTLFNALQPVVLSFVVYLSTRQAPIPWVRRAAGGLFLVMAVWFAAAALWVGWLAMPGGSGIEEFFTVEPGIGGGFRQAPGPLMPWLLDAPKFLGITCAFLLWSFNLPSLESGSPAATPTWRKWMVFWGIALPWSFTVADAATHYLFELDPRAFVFVPAFVAMPVLVVGNLIRIHGWNRMVQRLAGSLAAVVLLAGALLKLQDLGGTVGDVALVLSAPGIYRFIGASHILRAIQAPQEFASRASPDAARRRALMVGAILFTATLPAISFFLPTSGDESSLARVAWTLSMTAVGLFLFLIMDYAVARLNRVLHHSDDGRTWSDPI